MAARRAMKISSLINWTLHAAFITAASTEHHEFEVARSWNAAAARVVSALLTITIDSSVTRQDYAT